MRILYITYDGLTDQLGQSQIIPYLKGLSEKGCRITILSCEKKAAFLEKRENLELLLKGLNINWVPILYTKKPPVLSTLWDLWKLRSEALKLQKENHFHIVHCRSYIAALIGLYLRNSFTLKFIFDMRGFWPEERVEGGIWNTWNPIYKAIYTFFKNQERAFFAKADHIVSLTLAARKEIEQRCGKEIAEKTEVIPCCVDTDLFDRERLTEEGLEATRRKINIHHKDLVIGYLGAIGTWYMLDEMLEFFSTLLKKHSEAILLVITHEDPKAILMRAHDHNIDTVNIRITSAERKEVPYLLSLCAAGLFFIRPTYSKKASSPTKLGEFLSMGVPVIINDGIGDSGELVKSNNIGICLTDFTAGSFEHAALRIQEVQQYNKAAIRQVALKNFDLQSGIEKYLDLYQK